MNGNKDSKKEDSIAFKWSRLYHAFEDRGGNILFKVLTHLTTYLLTHLTTYLLTHQGEPAAYVGGDRQGND
jgi:hypothetical protein